MLKICMIGLGSIGQRHMRNLTAALKRHGISYQIDALRSGCAGSTFLGEKQIGMLCRQYVHINELPDDYDIIFVTNPTFLHYQTMKKTICKTRHMFIEKPVFEDLAYDINCLPLKEGNIYYVACPLRHKSILRYVKQMINSFENEKIVSVRILSTSYLPSWREGDYRTVYSAKRELGGGVTRDLIHEWDYAVYLFGNPEKVYHMNGHVSDLEIDSDDVSVYIARYPHMFLEMHLDYIGQKAERKLQIFTTERRMDIDLVSDKIYEYQNNKRVNCTEFPKEDHYMNEIEYFLNCIDHKTKNINTIADAYYTLQIALAEEL